MKTRVKEESRKEEEKRTVQYFDLKLRFMLLLVVVNEVLRVRVRRREYGRDVKKKEVERKVRDSCESISTDR
jgi:hypothetical protein